MEVTGSGGGGEKGEQTDGDMSLCVIRSPSPSSTQILWLRTPARLSKLVLLTQATYPATQRHTPEVLGLGSQVLLLPPPLEEIELREAPRVMGWCPPTSDLHADAALDAIGHELELSTMQAGRY